MADYKDVPPAEAMRKMFERKPSIVIVEKEPQEQFWPGSAMAVWQGHSDAVLALIRKKDAQYGGAWAKQGYIGNLARIFSKSDRLRSMMWRDGADMDQHPDPESVLDTLYDLSALCAMAIANIEEGNRWGK